jgi:hypothetical protein
MATLNNRLSMLESLFTNRPLSKFSDAELEARIKSTLGYLPNAEESAVLIKQLRHKRMEGLGGWKNGNN